MIKKPLVFLLAAGCFASAASAHASWLERLSPKKWLRAGRTSPKAGKAATAVQCTAGGTRQATAAVTEKYLADVMAQAARQTAQQLAQPMQRSVFTMRLNAARNFMGSGFIVQYPYKNKMEIWGVTASHLIPEKATQIEAAFLIDGKPRIFTAEIAARGQSFRNDLLLLRFKTDQKFLNTVRPLSLTSETNLLHTPVQAFGFSHYSTTLFAQTDKRIAYQSPTRLLATVSVSAYARSGTCGGPLVDAQGQVIGMHCGTSCVSYAKQPAFLPLTGQHIYPVRTKQQRVTHAVNIHQIKQLILAAHQKAEPDYIYWHGTLVDALTINEYILQIKTYQGSQTLRSYLAAQDEPFLDERYLEKFIDATNADRMRISITDGNIIRQLWFDLKTRQVTQVKVLRNIH